MLFSISFFFFQSFNRCKGYIDYAKQAQNLKFVAGGEYDDRYISYPKYWDTLIPYSTCSKNYCKCPKIYGKCPKIYGKCPKMYDKCPKMYGKCPKIYGKCPKICMVNVLKFMVNVLKCMINVLKCMVNVLKFMVNVLKFWTLYSVPFWPKFCFLCSCFLKYLVEWQTV